MGLHCRNGAHYCPAEHDHKALPPAYRPSHNRASLGVFYLVINTILLYVAASMGNALFGAGFVIDSFGSGFVASIVISIVSGIMNSILGTD